MSIFPQSLGAVDNTPWDSLPREIRDRLAAEGVNSPADWRALSRGKRRSIFGVTPSMVLAIDVAAEERRP